MDIQKNDKNSQHSDGFSDSFFESEKENYSTPLSISPANYTSHKHKSYKKVISMTLGLLLFLILAWFGYFGLKLYSVGKKITVRNENVSAFSEIGSVISSFVSPGSHELRGEKEGRINILLLGAAGKGKPGQNLTDTIMIMSIDTKNNRLSLLSLPRDLYVQIPETSSHTKINSLYQYGLSSDQEIAPIKKSVEEITGLNINYFLIVDFEGFTKIINDIGGINIMNERDIYDSSYPGPNYSYETFKLDKGFQHLDGATALKYVRERHNDPDGDFGRAKRQQQVIQATKNKVFSLGTFLNFVTLDNLLNTLGDNIKTDIAPDEIESFVSWSQKVDTQNIINVVADAWEKNSLLKVSHTFFGNTRAFILVPRVGNYSEIQDLAANIFDLDAIRRRQAEIEKESAKVSIINQSGEPALTNKIRILLKDKLKMDVIESSEAKNNLPQEKTTVLDNTQGQKIFTLDELIKKLPASLDESRRATLSSKKNDIISKVDLVVILGKDLIKLYGFEEDSIEEFNKAQDNQEYFIQ